MGSSSGSRVAPVSASECQPCASPVPALCHPCAIPVPSLCHPCAIPMPASAILVPALCQPCASSVPALCQRVPVSAIPAPSLCQPCASESQPRASPVPARGAGAVTATLGARPRPGLLGKQRPGRGRGRQGSPEVSEGDPREYRLSRGGRRDATRSAAHGYEHHVPKQGKRAHKLPACGARGEPRCVPLQRGWDPIARSSLSEKNKQTTTKPQTKQTNNPTKHKQKKSSTGHFLIGESQQQLLLLMFPGIERASTEVL